MNMNDIFNICRIDDGGVKVIHRVRGEQAAIDSRNHYYKMAAARGSSARFFIKHLPDAIARHLPTARNLP
jgi:hypothetical protein